MKLVAMISERKVYVVEFCIPAELLHWVAFLEASV